MKLSKNFFKNFLFSEMPLSDVAILYEQREQIFETQPRRFLICMVSASFSKIFTRIRRTTTTVLQFVRHSGGHCRPRKITCFEYQPIRIGTFMVVPNLDGSNSTINSEDFRVSSMPFSSPFFFFWKPCQGT